MKKISTYSSRLLLLIFLISVSKFSTAQNWIQVGNGVPSFTQASCMMGDSLVVACTASYNYWQDDSILVSIWNGSFFSTLPTLRIPNGFDSLTVSDMIEYNGELYVAGNFDSINSMPGTRDIVKWDGAQWESVGGGADESGFSYVGIRKLAVYNNELYAFGDFTGMNGVSIPYLARWNGSVWQDAGFPAIFNSNEVVNMLGTADGLYLCGYFTQIGNVPATGIAKWNGAIWSDVGGSITSVNGNGFTMGIYNGDLFLSGYFTKIGNTPVSHNIARWDGTTWYDASAGFNVNNYVFSFATYNNKLWASGYFISNSLMSWDGTTWTYLANGNPLWQRLNSNGQTLYGDGYYDSWNGINFNYIAQWCDNMNCGLVTGHVYHDDNANCIQNNNEGPFMGVLITAGNNYITTDTLGDYALYLPPGSYTVSHIPSLYWSSVCPASNSYNVNIAVNDPVTGINFGDTINAYVQDIQVTLDCSEGVARVDSDFTFFIDYSNIGSMTVSGSVELKLDPMVIYLSALPAPDNISGNVYTWNFSNLAGGDFHTIDFNVHIPGNLVLHSYLLDTVTINPVSGDLQPSNNTYLHSVIVGNAWDPNDKVVMPAGEGATGDISTGDSVLTYHVDFQNTGNAIAHNVIIIDTLDESLNPLTLQFIAHSHNFNYELKSPGYLTMNFPNIELPDSGSNEPGSHGFIEYSVHLDHGLTVGTPITNSASIYFDSNQPIKTNTTLNTIDKATSIYSIIGDENISLFPNPANDVLTIQNAGNRQLMIEIENSLGQIVFAKRIDAYSKQMVSTRDWVEGIYLVSDESSHALRFIVAH